MLFNDIIDKAREQKRDIIDREEFDRLYNYAFDKIVDAIRADPFKRNWSVNIPSSKVDEIINDFSLQTFKQYLDHIHNNIIEIDLDFDPFDYSDEDVYIFRYKEVKRV